MRIVMHFRMANRTLLHMRMAQIPSVWLPQRCQHRTQNCHMTQNLFPPKLSGTRSISRAMLGRLPSPDMCSVHSSLSNLSLIFSRHKSRRRQQDSDDESGSDMDDKLDEDDFEAPPQFKVVTVHAPSLRTDAVLSNSINVSRNRLEELFFASCLLLNGSKMTKKGVKMDEGDFVDIITEKLEGQIKVKRVKLLKINPEKTGTGKFILKVRVWRTPFLLDFTRSRERP